MKAESQHDDPFTSERAVQTESTVWVISDLKATNLYSPHSPGELSARFVGGSPGHPETTPAENRIAVAVLLGEIEPPVVTTTRKRGSSFKPL